MRLCTDEDIIEVILPYLASSLSAWQYLSARAGAVTSLSSPSTNSTAAVARSKVDVAAMLDEYAALHRSVRSFCSELLEKETLLADAHDQVAQRLPEKDSAASSAVPNAENCHPENDSVSGTETAVVSNTGSMQNVDDLSSDRSAASFSETLQSGDSSTMANCSDNVPSVNGDLSEFGLPHDLAAHFSVHNSESNGLSVGELLTDRNTATTESVASDGNKNAETGNIPESNGSHHAASRVTPASSETNGFLTLCADEKSDNVGLPESDCCEKSCGIFTADVTDGEVGAAVKTGVVETAAASCKDDSVSSLTADDIQPASDCRTACTENDEVPSTAVVAIADDLLEVSLIV